MQRLMGLSLTILALAGCSNWQDTFRFNKSSPDEFAVMAGPHLTVPDNFDLPEPQPPVPQFRDARPSTEAKQLLMSNGMRAEQVPMDNALIVNQYKATAFMMEEDGAPSISQIAAAPISFVEVADAGNITTGISAPSKGEDVLLKKARTQDSNDNIKKVIFDETVAKQGSDSQGFLRGLWSKVRQVKVSGEPTVNAAAEKERITKDIKAGRPVTGDETKVVDGGAKGWLQHMLGIDE